MTAPATEKAAPIPAEVLALRDRLLAEHERFSQALSLQKGVHVLHDGDIEKLTSLFIEAALLADQASQEERIREDERAEGADEADRIIASGRRMAACIGAEFVIDPQKLADFRARPRGGAS